ncbi:MAG: low specificity L-threonine aldolase [Bacteroidales bacterium]
MRNSKGFASDNNSGVHPDIMKALNDANEGHTFAYGDDPYTREAYECFREIFGKDTEIYFVFLGTAANVLGLGALSSSYNSVICAETAHINEDECGAPEKFNGFKLLPVETDDGKINIEGVKKHIKGIDFEHHSQPKIISVTQATELGTVYTVDELREITQFAQDNNLFVHMDGARIANAAVSLNKSFREITRDVGIDVLSFGGTKNGMMYGEAILFFNQHAENYFKYIRKQGMQLASKMRFISAQFLSYLSDDLWYKNARKANHTAGLLAEEAGKIQGIEITRPVEANGVFAKIPASIIPELQKSFKFYVWEPEKSVVRWMTSFDTTEEDIYMFVQKIKELMKYT